MSNMYATCYFCEEMVYLYRKTSPTTTTSLYGNKKNSTNTFFKRHKAIIKRGFIMCLRCNLDLNKISLYSRRSSSVEAATTSAVVAYRNSANLLQHDKFY